jgi:hypothetical protein
MNQYEILVLQPFKMNQYKILVLQPLKMDQLTKLTCMHIIRLLLLRTDVIQLISMCLLMEAGCSSPSSQNPQWY